MKGVKQNMGKTRGKATKPKEKEKKPKEKVKKPTKDQQVRIDIFENTKQLISDSDELKKAVAKSIENTKVYEIGERNTWKTDEQKRKSNNLVILAGTKTQKAARDWKKTCPSAKVCVLDFAPTSKLGEGAEKGLETQEASLCRETTLYEALKALESQNKVIQDKCLYVPEIQIIRDSSSGNPGLEKEQFTSIDVIVCSAPDASSKQDDKKDINSFENEMRNQIKWRAERVIEVALENDVDILILGAWGCGECKNNPKVVAEVLSEIAERFKSYFMIIEFAVYSKDEKDVNYREFWKVINNG